MAPLRLKVTDMTLEVTEHVSITVGDLVRAGRFLEVPESWIREHDGLDGFPVTVYAEWDEARFAYSATRIEVEATGGEPVTSVVLRNVPVARLIEETSRTSMTLRLKVDGKTVDDAIEAAAAAAKAERGPTPRALDALALVYETAIALGQAPVKAIQDLFELPSRTATHWVKLARERGHLVVPAAATRDSRGTSSAAD